MKRLFTSISLSVFCVLQIFGQEVDEKTAQIVAEQFYSEQNKIETKVKEILTRKREGEVSFYVCNLSGEGWVIVPANKFLPPVIAYSDSGRVDLNTAPEVFLDWMKQYEDVVTAARKDNLENEKTKDQWDDLLEKKHYGGSQLKNYISRRILLTTDWEQGRSKDGYCPGYNKYMRTSANCSDSETCNKCAAGCGAVAIGQIMHYWGYSQGDSAAFDWWNMPRYLYHQNNANYSKHQEAISYLLKRLGDESNMVYCNENSCKSTVITSGLRMALSTLGYNNNSLLYNRRNSIDSIAWKELIKNEIYKERPLLYLYQNYSMGHVFVCDGFDEGNSMFHFNLGFETTYNTWYYYSELLEIFADENYHGCIKNIWPNAVDTISLNNNIIQTVNNIPSNKTFQAKKHISVAGNNAMVEVRDNSYCRLIAGESIELKPGFHVHNGASFEGIIYKKNSLKSAETESVEMFLPQEDGSPLVNPVFSIYPNPTKEGINIKCNNYDSQAQNDVEVFIYNLKGELVYKEKYLYQQDYYLNIKNLISGIYVVNIKCDSKIFAQTFIKNN